ncbi:protein SCO1/2 [Chitinophaga sp. YR627]|jgi:protein SCO1/2|uniref:SCO family protein n=1 Tax=Chitinophaga sp. YR627 TaxID=1881041 RepID=UPI0008E9F99D|nr:SCO family protein [Chitinophaga sp. YR627]SFN72481.1 protein SCO1/2 [Chitinophaga sp. YR627]
MLAILVPLAGYLIVDHYSKNVVPIPRYYIPEGVDTIVKNGTTTYDTTFHVVKDITLTNQMGRQVSLKDLPNKVILVNFFFTSCPSICPRMMANLEKIQQAYVKNDTLLQLVSLTVDPERDSSETLRMYGVKHGINPDNWWLLTGAKKDIYDWARNEVYVSVVKGDGGPDDFIHTEKLVLLDKNHNIRGYYDGLDSNAVRKCANDIAVLHLEKDKHRPGLLKRLFSTTE